MRFVAICCAVGLLLAGCSAVPHSSAPQKQTERHRDIPQSRPTTATPVFSARPSDQQCLATLGQAGVSFTPLPDRYLEEGCTNLGTVQMRALAGDELPLQIANIGPVTCPVSAAFAAWARFGVDRAARSILGSGIVSIQTMGSYSCRNVAGSSRRSAHASAAAIDIAGFVLADGRRISVKEGWQGTKAQREFLRTVQASACRRFATVLGPDYNTAHEDHLHLEGVIDGKSFCR